MDDEAISLLVLGWMLSSTLLCWDRGCTPVDEGLEVQPPPQQKPSHFDLKVKSANSDWTRFHLSQSLGETSSQVMIDICAFL
jgi:hypothetical protein